MRTHAPGARTAAAMTLRSRGWSSALALALAACWYPKERGQRLEQRLERVEGEAPIRQQPQENRGVGQDQAKRIEARLGEMEARLHELQAASKDAKAERSARQDKADRVTEELGRLRAAIEGQARRLDAVERSAGQAHASARRAPPERKVASAGAAPPKAEAPPAPQGRTGVLAMAREQEGKGQKAVARDLYEEYVRKFPTEPDAAQAHFRLGELAFGERRYKDAIAEFGKVAKDFPRSGEAPDALLRTADSMMQMDLREDAAAVLAEIPKRYPASPAAARAKERLAELSSAKAPPRKQK